MVHLISAGPLEDAFGDGDGLAESLPLAEQRRKLGRPAGRQAFERWM